MTNTYLFFRNFTGVKSHGVNVSQILQLTSDFKHQSNISEEISYTTVPDWEQFFFANISKTVIAMVATSERHYEADKPAVKDQLQKEIAHVTPAQKLQPVTAFPGEVCKQHLIQFIFIFCTFTFKII